MAPALVAMATAQFQWSLPPWHKKKKVEKREALLRLCQGWTEMSEEDKKKIWMCRWWNTGACKTRGPWETLALPKWKRRRLSYNDVSIFATFNTLWPVLALHPPKLNSYMWQKECVSVLYNCSCTSNNITPQVLSANVNNTLRVQQNKLHFCLVSCLSHIESCLAIENDIFL